MATTTTIDLYLAKSVATSTEDCDTYIPVNGAKVKVIAFHGEAAFSSSSAVKVVWDLGGTEIILWSIKGSAPMPKGVIDETEQTGDNVKKIALCLDNGEGSAIFMSGHATIEVTV